jgi:hypothetical protein
VRAETDRQGPPGGPLLAARRLPRCRGALTGLVVAVALGMAPVALHAQADEDRAADNDGTDPTRPVRSATLAFSQTELTNGVTARLFEFKFNQPLGAGRSAVQLVLPLASVNAFGETRYGLGDIGLRYSNVAVVTPQYGLVLQLEAEFPTAARPELGSGRTVLKPAVIYARFLRNGAILAPSLLHNVSVGGGSNRPDVNLTTFDLYFVPRLANPRAFMTLDPALNYDWEARAGYGAFAVTYGYRLGPMLGGVGQVYIKPSTTFGKNRPVDWGLEVGFQVVNF